jgi:biopolymer transport protein ExbD
MAHKRSHGHGGGGGMGGVNLNIIITPMLDMAFQLLAFFIMTYHPSALEGHIDGTLLPPTSLATKGNKTEVNLDPATDDEPKLTETLLVKVKAVGKGQSEGGRQDGEPRWIELLRAEAGSTPLTVNGNPSARDLEDFVKSLEEDLNKELKKILKEPGSLNTDIKLEADPDLKHRFWMKFYDVCKLSGFKNIHFVSPPQNQAK